MIRETAGKHAEGCFFVSSSSFRVRVSNAFTVRLSLLPQYFEYTSQKEIRFNTVTELCAEVPEGKVSVGMRHCPGDGESRPASTLWEFRQVHLPFLRKRETEYTSR